MNGNLDIKHPWLAVFLSSLLSGAGQIYAGKKLRGIIFISLWILLSAAALTCGVYFFVSDNVAGFPLAVLFVAVTIATFLIGIYALFDAYRMANKYNTQHNLIPAGIKKKPWLAVFLSYTFPGIGQFYNKQILKGLAFIIGTIVLLLIDRIHYLFAVFLIPLYFFVIKDAFESAEKINGTNEKLLEQGSKSVRAFVIIVLLLHLVPFPEIIKVHFIKAYKFPSGSMIPSLLIGDHILIDKTSKDSIKRGDIIVFKYPENPNKDFIKRVVAVEGDVVELRDKVIYINGKQTYEPYAQHTDNSIRPMGVEPRDNFGPITIPPNKFFVMGDNRDQSYDSRYWGYVPQENVKGRVFKIYWSWDSVNREVRWERIGKPID
jgi:signal peptidase I